MTVSFDKVQPGMVLFHRCRRSVGNVRGMTALEETRLRVRGVDAERRVVHAEGPRGGVHISASHLGGYFTWSMHDSDVAEVVRSAAGHVIRVVRKKGAKKATPGREWYTSPDSGVGVTVDPARKPQRSTGPTTSPAPRPTNPACRYPLEPAAVLRAIRAQVADSKALGPDYVDALSATLERVAAFNTTGLVAVREELAHALDTMRGDGFFARTGVADPREG